MPPSPAAVVRLGVIGGGLIAQLAHLPALRALDGLFAVLALAEPSPRVREPLARRHGIRASYSTPSAMLDAGGLDAVLVCSPNGTHAAIVRDALAAGLHVLVEKPLCLRPADAAEIVALAHRSGRVVQVGYMKQFDPGYERLRAELPTIGQVRLVTSVTVDPGIGERLRPAGFIADMADAGAEELRKTTAHQVASAIGDDDPRHVAAFSGAFLGALVHDVNLVADALAGPWRVLDGASQHDGSLAYGTLAADDGTRWTSAWLRVPNAAAFREELTLHGADGVLRLRFPAPYLGSAPGELRADGTPERRWCEPANAYVRQLEHFHACITRGVRCRAPAEQGARDVGLLTELYRKAVAA